MNNRISTQLPTRLPKRLPVPTLVKMTALGAVLVLGSVAGPAVLASMAGTLEQPRKLAPFTQVTANGSSDVFIKVGPKQSVVVHGEDDEIENIRTEVKNGKLTIWRESRRGFGNRHSAHVVITVPALTGLASRGSGDAVVEGMKAKSFRLVQQGSGDVALDGTCDELEMTSQGSGDLESARLNCAKIEVTLQGSGDMELDAVKTDTLTLDAVGSGDVYIKGSCKDFDLRHMASGDVDANKFKCSSVAVKASGSGDMRVFASEEVTIKIRGSGDVEVYGGARPTDMSTSGSGHIRFRK